MGKTDRPEDTEKLKVLCLHGYRQNGESFRSKIGSFRKFVNKFAEFTFLDAPHIAPPIDSSAETDGMVLKLSYIKHLLKSLLEYQKSWWFNKEDGTFKGTNKCGPAFGFEESLRLVEKTWIEQGPFQGLLGFSQGACFVGLLCALAEQEKTTIDPQFAIMGAGFRSGSLAHINYYQHPVTIPTIHIYGDTDDIINKGWL